MPLGVSSFTGRSTKAVLPDACFILSRTEKANGAGGRDISYEKSDEIACAIAPLKGGRYTGARALPKPAGDRLDDRTTNVITLPAGTALTEKDKIEVVGWGVFEVTALRRRSIEILREVEVREAP